MPIFIILTMLKDKDILLYLMDTQGNRQLNGVENNYMKYDKTKIYLYKYSFIIRIRIKIKN